MLILRWFLAEYILSTKSLKPLSPTELKEAYTACRMGLKAHPLHLELNLLNIRLCYEYLKKDEITEEMERDLLKSIDLNLKILNGGKEIYELTFNHVEKDRREDILCDTLNYRGLMCLRAEDLEDAISAFSSILEINKVTSFRVQNFLDFCFV